MIGKRSWYWELNYPERLVDGKIIEIRNRNFKPKTDQAERLTECSAYPDNHFYLKLTFTQPKLGFRTAKVGWRIDNSKHSVLDFRLNIICNTIKLSPILSQNLWSQIVVLELLFWSIFLAIKLSATKIILFSFWRWFNKNRKR
jgi:hypothetical protein